MDLSTITRMPAWMGALTALFITAATAAPALSDTKPTATPPNAAATDGAKAAAGEGGAPASRRKKPTIVSVETATTRRVSDQLLLPARVDPEAQTDALAPAGGTVVSVNAHIGARVVRGVVLAVVRRDEAGFNYAAVELRAPISGVVTAVSVVPGAIVFKDKPLISIADVDHLKVVAELPGDDIAALTKGQRATFTARGERGKVATATLQVRGIAPIADPRTGTHTVELVTAGEGAALIPGGLGRVTFVVRPYDAMDVPTDAIVYRARETLVRVVEGDTVRFKSVSLGRSRGERTEITAGLPAGSVVIVRANRYVAEGAPVAIEERKGAAE